ncbi:MAG: nitrogen fixation protein NifZ [Methylococcaceae bacterium]|jgi:nitrogen fixation protein NifZ
MKVEDLGVGDMVYASARIVDDGSTPGGIEGTILAEVGARGVITQIGHLEDQPDKSVFLVSFENDQKKLGEPIGCWPEDLLLEPILD